ncbi:hypothetical protein Tco_1246728 [Tanacetum coccineum]
MQKSQLCVNDIALSLFKEREDVAYFCGWMLPPGPLTPQKSFFGNSSTSKSFSWKFFTTMSFSYGSAQNPECRVLKCKLWLKRIKDTEAWISVLEGN